MLNNLTFKTLYRIKSLSPELIQTILSHIEALPNADVFLQEPAALQACLLEEDEEGYQKLPTSALASFLEGLIIEFRGPRTDKEGNILPPTLSKHLDNNTILKKLRIALELQADDMQDLFDDAGFDFSRHEISAYFRAPDHKHYKNCPNDVLMGFLTALQIRG